ncbi:ferritin-like domain-containing protein [Candidatus Saganbacteria bacterium]|nr:ferritin-like domain-containing protein [Candidatus Saganbacteria bacterium]
MASEKMLDLLNQGIARELQVVVQYMWQHVVWSGVKHYAVSEKFKEIAIQEMKHAEKIADRLNYFNGIPTTKPTPIFVGNTLKEMMEQDKKDEEGALKLYNQIIDLAKAEKDETTYKIFQDILSEEEEHLDFFVSALEEV